jgi:anti-sigma regulatory factor (Ser/Thr protein kinase)
MEIAPHVVIPVVETSQPSAVRFAARERAERMGFSESDSYRAGLVATELATNLVKHAHGGEVLLRGASNGSGPQLELLAIDKGPGMANVSAALVDGQSTAGTNGIGLGAVARMSDEFDIHSSVPHGTVVLARVRPKGSVAPKPAPFAVAGISVPKAGETECGDAWTLTQGGEGFSTLVADGLGHGPFAAEAAAAAIRIAGEARGSGGCARILAAVHDGIRHTRGAAAAIAEVSRARRVVTFAGVGNIGAAIVDNGSIRQAVSHNGTLGYEARVFREYTYPWSSEALLVMHSDGLISHWSLTAYPGLRLRHPAVVAGLLYRDFNRGRDDVTVVVAREVA